MKQLFASISAVILAFFLLSCGKEASHRFSLPRESRSGVLLTGLDSLIDANPDSALKMLDAAIKQEENKIGKSVNRTSVNLMRLELLRAKARNKACVPFRADSLAVMQKVADYYHRKGNANDRMLSLYLLGCAYRDLGSAPRAIETWQLAVEQADTSRADCDLSTLMRIHSQMANLFRMQRLPEYEQKEVEIAETLCWKMKDTLSAIAFEQASCNSLFNNKKYKECIQRAQTLYESYIKWGYYNKAALVCVYALKSYLALGEYGKAKPYLDIYGAYCLSESDHRKIDGGLAPYYIYKGNYYLGIGNLDSAEYCFRQAMPDMAALNNDVAVYKGLQKVYEFGHQADSVLKYSNLYGKAKEYSYEATMNIATLEAKNLYDYGVEQREAQKQREKAEKRKTWIINAAWCVILLISIFFLYDMQRRKKYKHLKREYDKIAEDLIASTKKLADARRSRTLLEKKLNKVGIQDKKEIEKLKEEKHELDLIIRNHVDTTRKLQGQLELLSSELNKRDAGKKELELECSDIVSFLKHFLAHPSVNSHIPDEKWQELEDTINRIHPTFYSQVHQAHHITKTHYRVCMLTLAGFSSSEINALLEKGSSYASTIKIRLHQNIYGTSGKAEDFEKRIRSFA